jgi:uncharacterized protein YecT (DUF1311 family)
MRSAVLILCLIVTAPSGRRGSAALDDCETASTQTELNRRAHGNAARDRERMDRLLATVVDERGERERAAIQAAQRAWQAYADAQLEALYPGCAASAACGSAHAMCRDVALSALIRIRASELKRMVRKHHLEGDVCAPRSAYQDMP